jgi:ArsR family transcriptional regulator
MDSAEFLDLLGNENRRRILQLLARKPCYVTEISEFLGVSPKAVIDHLRKLEEAGLVNSRTDDRRRKYFSINRHVRLEVTVSPYEFGTKSAYPASTRLDLTTCRRLSIDLEDGFSPEGLRESDESEQSGAEETRREAIRKAAREKAREEDENQGGGLADRKTAEGEKSLEGPQQLQYSEDADRLLSGSNRTVVDLATRLQDLKQLERELSLAQRWTQGQITEHRDALGDAVGNGDPRLISELLLALAEGPKEAEALGRELDAPVSVVEEVLEELTVDGVVYRDGHEWHLDT